MLYNLFKKNSCILVYIAAALLAVSDTGIQLFILNTVGDHSRILRQLALFLVFFKIIGTRYTKKEFFILFPIACLSLYNYTLCGNIYCVWNILIIASLKDVDFFTLFKVLFWSTLGSLILIGMLSFWDIGGAFSLTQYFGREEIETRYCFGLYHPNIWHYAFARCIVYGVLGYRNKITWHSLSALFALNYIAYRFSASRAGFLTVSLFLILIFCYQYLGKLMHSLFLKVCTVVGTIAAFATYLYFLYAYVKYGNLTALLFDAKVTNGRIRHAIIYLRDNPIRFMGTRFPDDGTVFDCGFFRMFSESGWILGIIFAAAFLILLLLSLKNNWDHVTAACIFTALYSLYEASPASRPSYNIIVFFMAVLVYRNAMKDRLFSSGSDNS